MATDRQTLDKFWLFFGILILISIGAISLCIFILIQKPQSYIIAGISVLVYLIYEVVSIVLMVKWDMKEVRNYNGN